MAYPRLAAFNTGFFLNINQHRLMKAYGSTEPHDPYQFFRGDTMKCYMHVLYETGVATPLFYQIDCTLDRVAITDGLNLIYCEAAGIQAITPTTAPYYAFNLDIIGTELDNALRSVSSLDAVLEVHIKDIEAAIGTAYAQDFYVLQEPVTLRKSGLNPIP